MITNISSNRWPARAHEPARRSSSGSADQPTDRSIAERGQWEWEAVRTAALWPHDGDDGVGEPAAGDARGRHEPLRPLGRELALAVDELHRHPAHRVALLHLLRSRRGGSRARAPRARVGNGMDADGTRRSIAPRFTCPAARLSRGTLRAAEEAP